MAHGARTGESSMKKIGWIVVGVLLGVMLGEIVQQASAKVEGSKFPLQAEKNKKDKTQKKNDVMKVYDDLTTTDTSKEDILWRWRMEKRANPALTHDDFDSLHEDIRKEARKKYANINWSKVDP